MENEGDTQQRSGTVQSSLPIKGGESVKLIVKHPTGTLDFDDYPFVVDFIGKGKAESKQQISSLHMVSEFGFINETTSVKHQVRNNITNSVRLILKDDLKVPDSKIRTEKTQNEAEKSHAPVMRERGRPAPRRHLKDLLLQPWGPPWTPWWRNGIGPTLKWL